VGGAVSSGRCLFGYRPGAPKTHHPNLRQRHSWLLLRQPLHRLSAAGAVSDRRHRQRAVGHAMQSMCVLRKYPHPPTLRPPSKFVKQDCHLRISLSTQNSGNELCKERCHQQSTDACTFLISYAEGSSLSGILI
jgi:hypothetical protein